MPTSDRDPFDRMTEPASTEEAAAYLIEMLASMAHFANISNLHNSSAMLAAASQVVDQECRLMTNGPPNFGASPPDLPFPFNQKD
ncbi:MAG: hypothetical protein NXI12_03145 [Alphaproteobacteria bacterium]|nr:hypothetical protein [Alphaproteobacteria bacterium]